MSNFGFHSDVGFRISGFRRQPPGFRQQRLGFSFAEVMFAVVILGIGFILIAAIFPVAIQQTSATSEESNAASIARQAATSIAALPTSYANPQYDPTAAAGTSKSVPTLLWFPPTVKNYVQGTGASYTTPFQVPPNRTANGAGQTVYQVTAAPPAVVVPFLGARWDLLKANAILPNDPRYAFAAFYKRENNSSAAEVIVVAMTVRNKPTYMPYGDAVYAGTTPSINATISAGDLPVPSKTFTPGNDTIIYPDTVVPGGSAYASEGACLQVWSTILTAPTKFGIYPSGRTFSLGRFVGSGAYELMPGDDTSMTAGSSGLWGTMGRITCLSTTATPPAPAPASIPATLYPTSTLQPTVAYAQLVAVPTSPGGRIILTTVPGNPNTGRNNPPPASAATGAFVIIADDCPTGQRSPNGAAADYTIPPNTPGYYSVGALNGRIFRLGREVLEDTNMGSNGNPYPAGPGTFDLDPQYGMRPAGHGYAPSYSPDTIPNPFSAGYPARVYIIGAGRTDATLPNSGYTGNAQDIGAFATYFQVQ